MRWLVLVLALLLPLPAVAQVTATLVADTVTVTDGRLVATGNVQAYYDGTTLSAARISYDQNTDRLSIDGPIFIQAPDGTILTADQASLDPRFENGLLRGARLVLDQRLQLAANRIERVDGRYSQLVRTVATSCHVCDGRDPLWDIQADRVIHDTEEQQLYFDNATLRVRGVPILWLPRIRLPDPTLERATGLLIPRIRSNNQLGIGLRLPYFIRLGDSRDLTLTPYISSETNTLEARYRQAFLNGTLELNGAVSRDTLQDDLRYYLFADGTFQLAHDITLRFDVETVSDPAYLLDYSYSDRDRLDSAIGIERVRARDLLTADLTFYETLRDDERNSQLPPVVLRFGYEQRSTPALIGGSLDLGTSLLAFQRPFDGTGPEARDVLRLGATADWQRTWISDLGLVISAQAGLDADVYAIRQDPTADDGFRISPAGAITLRYPLIRTTPGGVTQIIEPVASLGWSSSYGARPPNEDATLAEFDEGNLFALTRFPGRDAREDGWHTTLGVSWTRISPSGARGTLTFGRLWQDREQSGYSPASGLSQQTSDWLLAGTLLMPSGFALQARTLFDENFDFDKTEARIQWTSGTFDLEAAYHWLPEDPTRERDEAVSEWSFDASYDINDNWTVELDGRYDVIASEPASAGLGLIWQNECVTVDLSVSRRYTSNENTEPSTDYGFGISLSGFSTGRSGPVTTGTCTDD